MKVLLYRTLVQSIILYNSETWTMKEEQKRKLRVFEMIALRKICGVTRKYRTRNVDILKELSTERDIISVIQCRRLTYFGHVTRMDKDRLPYILLYGYTHGSRGKGRTKKRWIDNIREDCMDIGIAIQEMIVPPSWSKSLNYTV